MNQNTGLPRGESGSCVAAKKYVAGCIPDKSGFWKIWNNFYCENHASLFEGTILRTNFIYHKFFWLEIPDWLQIKSWLPNQEWAAGKGAIYYLSCTYVPPDRPVPDEVFSSAW